MEKSGPRVYADARADSYEQSETHHMDSCSPGYVVPIYIRLFPRSAYVAVICRAKDGAPPIRMCCAEGCGRHLCIVQGRAQAFSLEEIHELFWCCRALMIILTGCHPMSFISAMFGVKKNEETAAEQEWVNSKPQAAELTAAGNAGILTPQSGGTGIITLSHPEAVDTVSIPYTVEAGNHPMIDPTDESKYLTASQSSYTADVGRIITMRASLINGKPIEALDIRWSTSDTGIVKILGTGGPEVSVQTLAAGTAAVIAQHAQSKNTLTFTVLVAGAGQIHLIPGKTAYLGSVGETMSVSATLYGVRSPVELLGISWSSEDAAIAQLVGSTGSSIQVIAKKVGTTTITPSHPKAQNSPPITIHVSAAKKRRQDVKYLAARTNAMELQIDSTENLRVRLIGGNALDEQGITWGVDDSTRLQMIGTSGSTVIVKGLMAGAVTVTASHPQSVNSLSITINVRDAVRKLLLSSSTMRLKKGDSAKALTLTIRGGFDTDYDNLAWSSSDTNVATVFGMNRTVNINPGSVPGNATITAELTLTGQKVTALVEVLPDMYIRLPRNMRVEEGKSETFTFEFATNGNPISFYPSDRKITVVQGCDANKNKITVTAGRKLDGDFSITARSAAGVQDSTNVEVFVNRELIVTDADKAPINIEPGGIEKAVVRSFKVVPRWEAENAINNKDIRFYVENAHAPIARFTVDPLNGTVAIHTTKEGLEALYIRDERPGQNTVHRIPIVSNYNNISPLITVSPPSMVLNAVNEHVPRPADNSYKSGKISINIPESVEVKSVTFQHWDTGAEMGITAFRHNGKGSYITVQKYAHENAIQVNMMSANKTSGLMCDDEYAIKVQYRVIHGARGDREYRGAIRLDIDGFWHCDP